MAEFISIGDKKDKAATVLFENYSAGLKTQRDAWCFNASRRRLEKNIRHTVGYYNDQLARFADLKATTTAEDFITDAPRDVSWTSALRDDFARLKPLDFDDGQIVPATYRPFHRQWLYFSRRLNERRYQIPAIFPGAEAVNRVIALSGATFGTEFSVIMTNTVPDLCLAAMKGGSQCFPLSLYDRADTDATDDLFALVEDDTPHYRTRHGITNAGLAHFQKAYPGETITKDDIFYYTYGLLHSDDYRRRFADNLTKELPRIPCVKQAADFWAFVRAGRALGDLHVGYEQVEPYPVTIKQGDLSLTSIDDPARFWRVEKMTFGKGKDRSVIHYNPHITLIDVPLEAYDYVVNGKPAIDWVMERQAVKVDKDSGIVNDANDYANETVGDPRYPFDLLCRVITVSIETLKIVRALPPLEI